MAMASSFPNTHCTQAPLTQGKTTTKISLAPKNFLIAHSAHSGIGHISLTYSKLKIVLCVAYGACDTLTSAKNRWHATA